MSVTRKRILGILCYFASLYTFHRFYMLSGTVFYRLPSDTIGLIFVLVLTMVLVFSTDFLGKYLFSVLPRNVLKRTMDDDFTNVLVRVQSGGLCYGCYFLRHSICRHCKISKLMNFLCGRKQCVELLQFKADFGAMI